MPKILVVWLYLALLPSLLGASHQHVAIARFDLDDVGPFIVQLNRQLGLRLHARVLSDYSRSIATGNEFSEPVDVHYSGLVLTITYKIVKKEPESIFFYFTSDNQSLIEDIRDEMKSFADEQST